MLEVKNEGDHVVIDLRERISKGEHPRGEVMKYLRHSEKGTVIEIHTPHYPGPLVSSIEGMGHKAVVSEINPSHYRLLLVVL